MELGLKLSSGPWRWRISEFDNCRNGIRACSRRYRTIAANRDTVMRGANHGKILATNLSYYQPFGLPIGECDGRAKPRVLFCLKQTMFLSKGQLRFL